MSVQTNFQLQSCKKSVDLSVIIPVFNAEQWLDECFSSILAQKFSGTFELSVFDDNSSDRSKDIIQKWIRQFSEKNINVIVTQSNQTRGPGYARNRAIEKSTGVLLCFVDADDFIADNRFSEQYAVASVHSDTIVGTQFTRLPNDSTVRYTNWANSLAPKQLHSQAYTSHGPTIILPTWMCQKTVFECIGGFDEGGPGTPEDLIFFYKHLSLGGKLLRVDKSLVTYRYHAKNTSLSVMEETMWQLRIEALQQNILPNWNQFTIWSAGKQGKRLYRSLSDENKRKVVAYCDVDAKKIAKGYYIYEMSSHANKPRIPIVHFTAARPPFVICVKQDLTNGSFEENLRSLGLTELQDYIHFG